MEIIADGGSTKVDWVVLNKEKKEVFRVRSQGLNPAVVAKDSLKERLLEVTELMDIKDEVEKIHFYGAGCGTEKPVEILRALFKEAFNKADIYIAEDMLAAVYAASSNEESIVCILGTGSNSCYYNGKEIEGMIPSLGYSIMDEASGNYFGKILLRDYFYKKMPKKLRKDFKNKFNLDADFIKEKLYRSPNPNMYLASFAAFMFDYKDEKYTKRVIKYGFDTFFKKRVLTYKKDKKTPIYFIGSIAYYFNDLLDKSAKKHKVKVTNVIQRPLDNLIAYHQKN